MGMGPVGSIPSPVLSRAGRHVVRGTGTLATTVSGALAGLPLPVLDGAGIQGEHEGVDQLDADAEPTPATTSVQYDDRC